MKTLNRKHKSGKNKPDAETFTVGPATGTEGEAENTEREERRTSSEVRPDRIQLSFDVNEDGTVDYSSMREKTKNKMRQVFSDPALADFLSVNRVSSGGTGNSEVTIFQPGVVSGFYDMLGALESEVMPMFFPKVQRDIWKKVFTYTPEEKAALVPPTSRVLEKYAGPWLIKWQDEIALAGILITMTVTKVNMAITLSKMADGSYGVPPKEKVTPIKEEPPIQ